MADENNYTIFIIDDEPVIRMVIADQLTTGPHDLFEHEDAASCLRVLEQGATPDILLLDVEMPGMDGISLCRQLRDEGNEAQILFVSSHDDLETRLAAYDAGGSDFIVKPFEPKELNQKIRVAVSAIESRRKMAEQIAYASSTAFTAMSSLGELQVVMEFMRNSFGVDNLQDLAWQLLNGVQNFGLSGFVGFQGAMGKACFSNNGEGTALEASIIGHLRTSQRIVQIKNRMVINFSRLTLVVSALPMDDPELMGRLRDHLALMAEAADARAVAMETAHRGQHKDEMIFDMIEELRSRLAEIKVRQETNRTQRMASIDAYLHELERSFGTIGLSEDQETQLNRMAQHAMAQITDVGYCDLSIEDDLAEAIASLHALLHHP
jgi:DNA-binding response OmpR family regulator